MAERSPRRSRLFTGVVLGLVLGGGLGGYAWFNERQTVATTEQEMAAKLDVCKAHADDVEGRLAEAAARTALLEARVEISRAVNELDDENFGQARKSMAAARAALADAEVEGAGELLTSIKEFRLDVPGDLAGSRQSAIDYAGEIDALLSDQ